MIPAVTRWIAAAGAGVISLDSIINVAFPAMAAAFAEPPERVRWVIVCYVFTYALTAFSGGALADRVGHARVFRVGLLLTAVALTLGALAPAFGLLLGARVLQGLGGGLVYGTAPGIVTLAAPPQARGRALGFLNAGIGVGFTVGPLVAGLLVAHLGWRSTFYVRVPIALGVFGWALAGLPAALGLLLLSRADATTSMPMIAVALFAAGFGLGMFQVPNMALIMGAFGGAQQGMAGGFAFLARTLGVVTGVLGLAGLFAARRESVGLAPAFGEAFLTAAIAVALAAIAALVLRRYTPSP